MSTETTLVHHLQALGGGQLEAVLSDYTEESIIFCANGVFKGLNAIQAFFDSTIKNTPPGMVEAFTMIRQDIEGEVAYILWKAEPFVPLGTDTFVVRNGKIMVQTFAVFSG
jgi:ketosteroid isomerase-like protein